MSMLCQCNRHAADVILALPSTKAPKLCVANVSKTWCRRATQHSRSACVALVLTRNLTSAETSTCTFKKPCTKINTRALWTELSAQYGQEEVHWLASATSFHVGSVHTVYDFAKKPSL
eukprot:3777518-Amphidinium_carterae.1